MRNTSIFLLLSVLSANIFVVSDASGIVCPDGYSQPFVSLFDRVGLGVEATSGAATSSRPGFGKEFGDASASDVSGDHWVLNYNVADYGNVGVEGSAFCAYDSVPSDPLVSAVGGNSDVAQSAEAITLIEKMDGAPESNYHCFCRVNSVSIGGKTSDVNSSKWAAYGYIAQDNGMDTNCYALCPQKCLETLKNTNTNSKKYFREALFANTSLAAESGCVGNTIQIMWENASQRDISNNNAATCTFGGDIKTPVKPEAIPQGKIFRGWKFEK